MSQRAFSDPRSTLRGSLAAFLLLSAFARPAAGGPPPITPGVADERVPYLEEGSPFQYPLWTRVTQDAPPQAKNALALAVEPGGTVHIAFLCSDNGVLNVCYANNRYETRGPASDGFSAPFVVSNMVPDDGTPNTGPNDPGYEPSQSENPASVAIAVAPDGTVHIVWGEEHTDPRVDWTSLLHRVRNPDGTWQAATTMDAGFVNPIYDDNGVLISSSGATYRDPVVAVDDAGAFRVAVHAFHFAYSGGVSTQAEEVLYQGAVVDSAEDRFDLFTGPVAMQAAPASAGGGVFFSWLLSDGGHVLDSDPNVYEPPHCSLRFFANGAITDPTNGDEACFDGPLGFAFDVRGGVGPHFAWTSTGSTPAGEVLYMPPGGPVETVPSCDVSEAPCAPLTGVPAWLRVDSRNQPILSNGFLYAKVNKADGTAIWGIGPGPASAYAVAIDARDVLHAPGYYQRTYEPNLGAQDPATMFAAGPGMSVDVANGNLFGTFPLFSTAGAGIPSAMAVYFNSKETQSFTMGRGFSHSYDLVLDRSPSDQPGKEVDTLRLADGRRVVFDGPNLTTDKDFDFMARVVPDQPSAGMATVITKVGIRYVFLPSGKLDSIHDTHNGALTCAYNPDCPSAGGGGPDCGRLASVTDSTGRVTNFAYGAGGLLTGVTDPGGHGYQLEYGGTSMDPQLTRIHLDATGLDLRWELDYYPADDPATFAKKGMISEVRTPRGAASSPAYGVDYTYYPDWRVRSAQDPAAPVVTDDADLDAAAVQTRPQRTFTYDDSRPPFFQIARALVQDRRDNPWIVAYYYTTNVAYSVTDPAGNAVYRSFDAYRTLTSILDKRGNVTSYSYDAGYPANLRDFYGPGWVNGFLHNHFEYSSDTAPGGNDDLNTVTAVTDTMGARTVYRNDPATGDLLEVDYPATTLVNGGVENAVERYTRDSLGRVLTYTDAEGGVTSYFYDDATTGLVTETCLDGQARGLGEQHTYDAMGRALSTTARPNDKPGGTTAFQLDGLGRVVVATDPLGYTTTYTYDESSNVVDVQNRRGFHTTSQYDARDLPTSVTTPAGTTSYAYDAEGQPRVTTDGRGFQTRTLYDTLGRALVVERDTGSTVGLGTPATRQVTYTYDAGGNVLTQTEADRKITYAYDPLNNPTQVFTGSVQGWDVMDDRFYDADGRLVATERWDDTFTFLSGTQTVRDQRGRPYLQVRLDAAYVFRGGIQAGPTTSILYDKRSQEVQVWDPNGSPAAGPARSRSKVYDGRGRLVATVNGFGQVDQQIAYYEDGSQQAMSVPDPQGGPGLAVMQQITYTQRGEVEQRIDALGNATVTTYDPNGNVTLLTEPLGKVTTFAYDAADRVVTDTISPGVLDITRTHTYDAEGNETSITVYNPATHHNDAVYTESYTADGRREQVVHPVRPPETWTYDDHGEAAVHVDPAGKTTTTTYDDLGRIASTTYGSPYNVTVTRQHDGDSNLLQISDGTTTQTTSYDALERPSSVSWTVGGMPLETIGYGYDAAGHRTSMTDPEGALHAYTYDADERPATLSRAGTVHAAWSYDAGGRVTGTTLANGAVVTRQYGPREELTGVRAIGQSGVLSGFAYAYDARGERVGLTREQLGEDVVYAVDADGRLLGETSAGSTASANTCMNTTGTPPLGNRSAYTNVATVAVAPAPGGPVPARALTYQYDPAGNRVAQTVNGITTAYTYDAEGRLLSEATPSGSVVHAYDGSGNETQRTSVSGATTTVEAFGYDYGNRLASYSRAVNGTTVASYTYTHAPLGQRLSKQDDLASTTEWYAYDGDDVVVDYEQAGGGPLAPAASYVQALGIDEKIARIDADGTTAHYYVGDALGTVEQELDAAQDVERSVVTDAWGNVVASSGLADRYGFTQRERDAESGLMHYRAREYDPRLGRFLQTDPLGDLDGSSLYAYARSSPTNFADPSGAVITAKCSLKEYLDACVTTYNESTANGRYKYDTSLGSRFEFGDAPRFEGRAWHKALIGEILDRMINTTHEFRIKGDTADECIAALRDHVGARTRIVENTSVKKFVFGAGSVHFTSPDPSGGDPIDEEPTSDPIESQRRAAEHGRLAVEHPQAFFESINNMTTRLDCNRACQVVINGAVGKVDYLDQRKVDVWIPGDWGYIANDAYREGEWRDGRAGENIIYAGAGLFWGHFAPGNTYETLDQWKTDIAGWKGEVADPVTGKVSTGAPRVTPDVKFPRTGLEDR